MASKTLSPTANLLRHSRLFSLPPPLPRPRPDLNSTESSLAEESATLPYPTHAAITAPDSSLFRGDWGLKRPLPAKASTSTANPIIRINALDTIDHITDYQFAADHALTLRKWQEMDIPIVKPYTALHTVHQANKLVAARGPASIWEEENDSKTAMSSGKPNQKKPRWKFDGPWLDGMSRGDFNTYLERNLKKRRHEFRQFLRERIIKAKATVLKRNALGDGIDLNLKTPITLSDTEFRSQIVRLRHEGKTLGSLAWKFLDLPGAAPQLSPESLYSPGPIKTPSSSASNREMPNDGPPTTHPSAGLSYQRLGAHVPNHPIFGPIQKPAPIEGRVTRYAANTAPSPSTKLTTIGVGGVVTTNFASTIFGSDGPEVAKDDDTGGAKVWVHPKWASIDAGGRINLHVEKVAEETLALWEGRIREETMQEKKEQERDRDMDEMKNYRNSPQAVGSGRPKALFDDFDSSFKS